MTDISVAPGTQQLVIDDLTCIQNTPAFCQEYNASFHLREGDSVQTLRNVSVHLQGANAQATRLIPLFQGPQPITAGLQQRYSQALADHQGLLRAARSLHSFREFFTGHNLGSGNVRLTPPSFDQFLGFIFLGNYGSADSVQLSRNVALLDRVFDYPAEEFRLIHWYSLAYLHHNAWAIPSLMSDDARLRVDLVRDWFALRSAFDRRVNGLYLSGDQKERYKVLFCNLLKNVYFGAPSLEGVVADLNSLGAEIIQNTQQGSSNIYGLLEEVLSSPLDHRVYQTTTDYPAYNEAVARDRNASLAQRQPFLSRELAQHRLESALQALRQSPLRRRFEYNQLENPIQAILTAKSRELAEVENVGLILRDAYSHSSIQTRPITNEWLSANDGARIREVFTALSFSEESANPNAPIVMQSRPSDLPVLSLRVARLRQAYNALIQRHSGEAAEYRAAALGIMLQVFGNGRARNEFSFIPNPGASDIRLPLDVDSRADLNTFYREIAGSLGPSNTAQQAQSVAQWASLALCVAGVGARVIYNSATASWDGRPDALLGVSGAFCGYAVGAFSADALGGTRASNRLMRNNLAGAASAGAIGVGGLFLPMAAGSSMSPPSARARATHERNPTTDFGP